MPQPGTASRTHATVARIRRETELEPAAHLTCVGASRGEINAVARGYWDAGIRHVVALRGEFDVVADPARVRQDVVVDELLDGGDQVREERLGDDRDLRR